MCAGDWFCRCHFDTTDSTGSTVDWQIKEWDTTSAAKMFNLVYIIYDGDEIVGWTEDSEVRDAWVSDKYTYEAIKKVPDNPPMVIMSRSFAEELYDLLSEIKVVNDHKGRFIRMMSNFDDVLDENVDEER